MLGRSMGIEFYGGGFCLEGKYFSFSFSFLMECLAFVLHFV